MPPRRAGAGLGLLALLVALLPVLTPAGAEAAEPKKPRPQLSIGSASVLERDSGGLVATFKISLGKGNGKNVSVRWATVDGTAKAPGDFTASSGTLTFKGPRKSQTRTVRVAIRGDDVVEPTETFRVVLSKPVGARVTRAAGTGTIRNDDSVPPTPQHTLSVTTVGTGTVTSSPAGISCGSVCSTKLDDGTLVTLTASPATGYRFTGWSGDCAGTTCALTMDGDRSVAATFEAIPAHALSVIRSGAGSGLVSSTPTGIDCGSTCSASYQEGAVVRLTATPDSQSFFEGWSGGGCTGVSYCDVTVAAATTVTASFAQASFLLSVVKDGAGDGFVYSDPIGATDIFCGIQCSKAYVAGSVVVLKAEGNDNTSVFTGWSGGGCSGTGTCVVTMSQATTVTATFTRYYGFSVTMGGVGAGTVTSDNGLISCTKTPVVPQTGVCGGTFPAGTTFTLTATAAAGNTFAGWTGACSGTGSCTVTLDNALKSVQAVFLPLGGRPSSAPTTS